MHSSAGFCGLSDSRTMAALGLLALLLGLARLSGVAAQNCDSMYKRGGKPLLYGGLYERCVSGCQSRSDYWGKACEFRPGSGWGVCSQQQASNALEVLRDLGGTEIVKLTPCHITPYLAGRTLWLIGDSHSKALYKALQCFLLDFWNHQECRTSPDWGAQEQLYNLPAAKGQSKCIHLFNGGRICMVHAVLGTSLVNNNQIAAGGVLPLLHQRFARQNDIFYVNFGVWHKKTDTWKAAFTPALEALGQYYQANKQQWPHLLFWETPAEHPKDRTQSTCMAMRGYTYDRVTSKLSVDPATRIDIKGWSSGASFNAQARSILTRYNIHIVPSYNMSVPLHDNHIGLVMNPELDCLHYCQNGLPQAWVYNLFRALRNGRGAVKALRTRDVSLESSRAPQFQCIPSDEKF